MKISWGIKIIISFVIFAAGIITMVTISFSSSTDLVSENYYEQEIKYQDQIDILNNSKDLNNNIFLEAENDNLILRVLESDRLKDITGEIYFYRTSDAGKDFKTDFKPNEEGIQVISSRNLEKGLWKVKLTLSSGQNKYFVEKNIILE